MAARRTRVRVSEDVGMRLVSAALLALSPSDEAAAAPRARSEAPVITYEFAEYSFTVPGPAGDDGSVPRPRDVEWSYPVFTEKDRATAQLNAWVRIQSLHMLLGDSGLFAQAPHLSDEQVIERAIKDQEFVDSGIDQAEMRPLVAVGIYRSFFAYGEAPGSYHPFHWIWHALYNVRLAHEQPVSELFKPDDAHVLDQLYDKATKRDTHSCDEPSFNWDEAELAGADQLDFKYGFDPDKDEDCDLVQLRGYKVTKLLKIPRDLAPTFRLEETY